MREETEAAIENTKGMLKDMVIVVSLVHTLTESFGSAKDLFLKLKRSSKKEDSSDGEDGDRKHRHRLSRRHGDSSSDSDSGKGRRHHLKWRRRPEENPFTDSDEELVITSSSRVRAEYDRGYNKLGEPFARGDLMTQIQLQSQIIELQKTLLQIHQDYMMSTYLSPSSSHSHLIRLIQTTRAARAASIYALHLQYERLLVDAQPDPVPKLPGSFPSPPARKPRSDSVTQRPHSRPGHRSKSSSTAKCGDRKEYHIQPYPITTPAKCDEDQEYHVQPYPVPPPAPAPKPTPQKLFCVFARDLQDHDRLPLTDNYKVSGDNMCPFCHAHIAIQPGKAWEVVSDNCHARTGRKRIFMVKSRFVIKSHREGHGFACILCAKYRRSDTVCKEIGALMEHLWKDHGANEMENDEDIVEIED